MSSDPGREADRPSRSFTRGSRAEGASAVPVNAVFDLLADETRRHVLYYLTDVAGGAATTADIADHLRAVDPESRSAEREAVLVGLHHQHLPRLEAPGVVEYDDPGGSVRYLGDPLVEECLALVAPWDLNEES